MNERERSKNTVYNVVTINRPKCDYVHARTAPSTLIGKVRSIEVWKLEILFEKHHIAELSGDKYFSE
jgi:hypothetical protein